jgi:hypothetical protein
LTERDLVKDKAMEDLQPSQMDEMRPYIDLADESSARGRRVIYVLVVATTLIGAAVWGYRPESWDNQEIAVVSFAARHLGEQPDPQKSSKTDLALFQNAKAYVAILGRVWKQDKDAKEFLLARKQNLQRMADDNYAHLKVPIIGVACNVNDIGLVGGFVLVVLLLVLRFALMREKANIKRTFEEAVTRGCLVETYTLLSMSQVLTVPPGGAANSRSDRLWNHVHKWLFVLPAIALGSALLVDVDTIDAGWVISPKNTLVELIGGGFFLVCVLFLTYSCFVQSFEMDRIWEKYASAARDASLAIGRNVGDETRTFASRAEAVSQTENSDSRQESTNDEANTALPPPVKP